MDTGIQVKRTPETVTIHKAGQPNSTFLTTSDDLPPLKLLTSQNDYEAHIGTKLNYTLFNSFYMFRTTELALLQNKWELERFSISNTIILLLESPRLVGYILTQNRFMFLETNGNVACFTIDLPVLPVTCTKTQFMYFRTRKQLQEKKCPRKHNNEVRFKLLKSFFFDVFKFIIWSIGCVNFTWFIMYLFPYSISLTQN